MRKSHCSALHNSPRSIHYISQVLVFCASLFSSRMFSAAVVPCLVCDECQNRCGMLVGLCCCTRGSMMLFLHDT